VHLVAFTVGIAADLNSGIAKFEYQSDYSLSCIWFCLFFLSLNKNVSSHCQCAETHWFRCLQNIILSLFM